MGRFSSKFTDVHHLYFPSPWNSFTLEPCNGDVMTFCETFPCTSCGIVKDGSPALPLRPYIGPRAWFRFLFSSSIDLWTGLNSLTLRGLHPRRPEPNQFSAWLVDRQASGLRRFHVKLIYFSRNDRSNPSIDFNFLLLYEILELD